jgi:hypothetical protein
MKLLLIQGKRITVSLAYNWHKRRRPAIDRRMQSSQKFSTFSQKINYFQKLKNENYAYKSTVHGLYAPIHAPLACITLLSHSGTYVIHLLLNP